MANGPFILTEQQVALRLGVPNQWVRSRRGPRGENWDHGDGGRVLWSETGANLVAGLLDSENPKTAPDAAESVSAPDTHGDPEKPASEPPRAPAVENTPPTDERVRLMVRKTGWKNPRVIHAAVVGLDESLVTVWVRNSTRFSAGMVILGRPWPGRPGVYTFAGNPENPDAGPREPRTKGRW